MNGQKNEILNNDPIRGESFGMIRTGLSNHLKDFLCDLRHVFPQLFHNIIAD